MEIIVESDEQWRRRMEAEPGSINSPCVRVLLRGPDIKRILEVKDGAVAELQPKLFELYPLAGGWIREEEAVGAVETAFKGIECDLERFIMGLRELETYADLLEGKGELWNRARLHYSAALGVYGVMPPKQQEAVRERLDRIRERFQKLSVD